MKQTWTIINKWSQHLAKNHEKPIKKSMHFSNPSKNNFLSPRDRFQTPKSRRIEFCSLFLAPPWILRGPQNHPKSATWHKMASRKLYRGDPGTNLLPRPSLKRSWAPFWLIFGRCLMVFKSILNQHLIYLGTLLGYFFWFKTFPEAYKK